MTQSHGRKQGQMTHSLTRFRQRVDPTASMRDMQKVLEMAADVHRQWVQRNRQPGIPMMTSRWEEGAVQALLLWKGKKFRAVYVPSQRVLRTILPGW